MRFTMLIVPLAVLSIPLAAYAQQTASNNAIYDDARGGGAIPALPLHEKTIGDIKYISGGVSEEEEAQIKSVSNQYNFHLLLNAAGGDYVSEVAVHISDDTHSPVLNVENVGPYLYAKLPPGIYWIEATNRLGQTKTAKLHVSAKNNAHAQIVFGG